MNPNQPTNSYQQYPGYTGVSGDNNQKDGLYELAKKVSVGGILVIVIVTSLYFTFQTALNLVTPASQQVDQMTQIDPVFSKEEVIDDLENQRPEVSDARKISILNLIKPNQNVSKAEKDEVMSLLASQQ